MPLTSYGYSLAGETARIQLQPSIQLGNQGGLLTLLNPAGLKVDGLAYNQAAGRAERDCGVLSGGPG
jgi:hypothetical protein